MILASTACSARAEIERMPTADDVVAQLLR